VVAVKKINVSSSTSEVLSMRRLKSSSPDKPLAARTTPNPTPWATPGTILSPSALDCAGDANSCFVADFEGNTIYKVTLNGSSFSLEKSAAEYFRPVAVKVQRVEDEGIVKEIVWVSDRKNPINIPTPNGTWTPYPTTQPATPTVGPGIPTCTPGPVPTSTPYPEINRISRVRFNLTQLLPEIYCAIPVNISINGGDSLADCWVADRNAGTIGNNQIKQIHIGGPTPTVIPWSGNSSQGIYIVSPVDVEAIED
jgi:hypothetical protein